MKVKLDAVVFDAGTQIRAAIDQQVVADYADAMTDGATFPPIVLFHDGNQHYLADGFHRFMAAQRNKWQDIDAEVRAGTKDDALWFAGEALREAGRQGLRPKRTDVKRAVLLFLQAWPDRSGRQIAEQVGCALSYVQRLKDEVTPSGHLPTSVTGKDGKSYPARRKSTSRLDPEKAARIEQMLRAGAKITRIIQTLKTTQQTVERLRARLGISKSFDLTKGGVTERRQRMRDMAAEGHTSRQIAAALGLSEEGCRATLKKAGIDVPADRATRGLRKHDAMRIMTNIVTEAETLMEDVGLVDFAGLDAASLPGWLESLKAARDKLNGLIKRLTQEYQKHEAA